MKHLQRRIIIRQYDYEKIVKQHVPGLYSTATFVPITLDELKKEHTFAILRNNSDRYRLENVHYEYPRNYLQAMDDRLYDKRYVDWFSNYDSDGLMWIQSRQNTPRSVLGWGVFEYNYQ